MTVADFFALAPVLLLAGGAGAVLLVDLFLPLRPRALAWIGTFVAAVAAVVAARLGPGPAGFDGALLRDGPGMFFVALIGIGTASALLLAADYLGREDLPPAEFVALVLFSAAGAGLMVQGGDLLIIALGLELLSLPLYALTGLLPRARHADEAALKYFLLGAAASAVLLYGVALLYAATGTIRLDALARESALSPLAFAGLALLLAGLAFKAALVPFHAWAPDVYESAPTPAVAFMALAAKVGAFGALLRIIAATPGGGAADDWRGTVAVLACLTLVLANLAALGQRKLKRLLGWSSIAHAGYIAAAVAAGTAPFAAFYLVVYGALTIAAFGILALIPNDDPALDDLAGLWRTSPFAVIAMLVTFVGLTGLPPTAGFLGKLYIFEALAGANLLWLLLVGVLASVVSAAYYLRVVLACFAPAEAHGPSPASPRATLVVVGAAALLVVAIGVVPGPLLEAVSRVRY